MLPIHKCYIVRPPHQHPPRRPCVLELACKAPCSPLQKKWAIGKQYKLLQSYSGTIPMFIIFTWITLWRANNAASPYSVRGVAYLCPSKGWVQFRFRFFEFCSRFINYWIGSSYSVCVPSALPPYPISLIEKSSVTSVTEAPWKSSRSPSRDGWNRTKCWLRITRKGGEKPRKKKEFSPLFVMFCYCFLRSCVTARATLNFFLFVPGG